MGDMKTPDFDDLLAAFDIPDMVDPKAAIESSHPNPHEGQHKPSPSGSNTNGGETHNSSAGHDIGISVIVQNIRNMDPSKNGGCWSEKSKDLFTKALVQSVSCGKSINNGVSSNQLKNFQCPKTGRKTTKGTRQSVTKSSPLKQFSPISSPEELDEEERIVEVNDPEETKGLGINQTSKKVVDNVKAPLLTPRLITKDQNNKKNSLKCHSSPLNLTKESPNVTVHTLQNAEEVLRAENECNTNTKSEISAKLSSCIAAISALSAKKASPPDVNKNAVRTLKSYFVADESVDTSEYSVEAEPTLKTAKGMLSKQPDSPGSTTSESSSKGSLDALIIPKVKIKTTKTSSGQIKRTVTHVLPDFDLDGLKKDDILDGQTAVDSGSILPSSSMSPSTAPVVTTNVGKSVEKNKQMTIKTVATAFLPVSAVKTAGSQVINLKLANNTTVKATVIPASSVQSPRRTILKEANAIQKQTIIVPASSLTNAKRVPHAVNLSNLNIFPSNTQILMSSVLETCKQSTLRQVKPAKKVANVQVVNSSQGTVVDRFNKIISGINPVPVYVPNLSPPTSADITLPSCGYKCLECSDSFALEKSLSQHYERRSVRIEVTCNHCAKGLVFYNKCSLLSHARVHKDNGNFMQCSHLILKPIPADQMIKRRNLPTGQSDTIISSTVKNSEGKAQCRGPQTVISTPCSVPVGSVISMEDHGLKPMHTDVKCLECDKIFQDDKSLVLHYQQTPDSSKQKSCSSCQMLLPNPCSLLSHQRIHQHKSPHICPECGISCKSLHFQSHITKDCFHYTRQVGYRCMHCSMIFAEVATLKSHIQSSHCEVFYKCPLCPMAFKSATGTHSHVSTQHPRVKAGEPKSIYKCSMCDTVFTQQSLLFAHFDQHVANHKVPVFKCPECSIYYAQRQVMLDHIKDNHGTLKYFDGPSNVDIFLPLSSKTTNSNGPSQDDDNDGGKVTCCNKDDRKQKSSDNKEGKKKPARSGYTCGECNTLFNPKEVYVDHMKREHKKVLKKNPCRQCEKSFSSSHSLCRHNRIKHRELRKVHCPTQTHTKRAELDQQTLMMHSVSQHDKKTEDSHVEIATEEKGTTQTPKRKQEEDKGSSTLNVRDSQPLKRLKVNIPKIHKCVVCGFTSEDVAAFNKHIFQHKSNGSSFQCHECGLCYTSYRSQARHLFIVHRVKEPRGGRDNESRRENTLDVTDENMDGIPNTKCKVCAKVFETEGSLNTHMRTHGMAFIKAKTLNSAQK